MSLSGEQTSEGSTPTGEPVAKAVATAGRKRAAVELIARQEAELRRTATRFSLCAEDAEDAYQRALEILLVKAPSEHPRELIRWTKTVVKHEALAIRRARERLLGTAAQSPRGDSDAVDPVALIPARGDGPGERVEGREQVARSREALRALKPAELRALTLLAAGYSYAEIGEATGFSQTKVNRCLAEGRERFRLLISSGEDGSRCEEMSPLLSAFCDGEADLEQARAVRDHLRACAGCRAAMRSYRATPATVAALAPALPLSRSLLERAQDLLMGLQNRLPGGGAADGGVTQVAAAGGTGGAGMAGIAKALAVCVGTVGGGAACVATGVAPSPADLAPQHVKQPRIERVAPGAIEQAAPETIEYEPAPAVPEPARREPPPPEPEPDSEAVEPVTSGGEAGAVEYAPPPPEPAPPASSPDPPAASSGSAAGEFGP